ncbi:MAG TPA: hypothetical protein VFA12_02430 [Stellaceae bacterium]|nr:hypothetical protein [Stellaceae bacterium]
MQKRIDDTLIAYLDGELDADERRLVEEWLQSDPAAQERMAGLAATASLVRSAYDDVLNEPVPERLIAAARGATAGGAEIVPFKAKAKPGIGVARRWLGLPAAAALAGLLVGGGAGYYGGGFLGGSPQKAIETVADNNWLDNAAGDYKLLVSAGDTAMIDVPATGDTREALQKISQTLPQVRLPNLKPWGLNFHGARLVVLQGRPAAQLVYTTDNKAIGPLGLIIGSSKQPDLQPTFGRRQDVNLLYWRHQGRSYVLAGQTDIGYLWGIANDVAWQLDAI